VDLRHLFSVFFRDHFVEEQSWIFSLLLFAVFVVVEVGCARVQVDVRELVQLFGDAFSQTRVLVHFIVFVPRIAITL